jgi:DNA polymerase
VPTDLRFPCESATDQAVLMLGEAPGYDEDVAGRNFVGLSGQKLDVMYVHGLMLNRFADIYVGNVVRCHLPGGDAPTAGQRKACKGYTDADIRYLSARYRRVVVVCCGAAAVQSVCGHSITEHSKQQGAVLEGTSNVYVFATSNPAHVLREPAMESKVLSILQGVRELLEYGAIQVEEQPEVEVGVAEVGNDGPLCLDLETEGVLLDSTQSTFHPVKMMRANSIPREKLIVCGSLAWREASGRIRTSIYRWTVAAEREAFIVAVCDAARSRRELWGQNIPFDLKVMRASDDRLMEALVPFRVPLRDLLVETFLYDDLAERGLKSVAWLYRITDYGDEKAPVRAYASADDPVLHKYCCKDAWATYRGIEIAREWQAQKFGVHPTASSKLSARRDRWFSDQCWSSLLMEEAGCCFDIAALRKVHETVTAQWNAVTAEALAAGVIVAGEGSDGSQRAVMSRCQDVAIQSAIRCFGLDSEEHRRAEAVIA